MAAMMALSLWKTIWKLSLMASSTTPVSPIVIDERSGQRATTFLIIVSKVGKRVPKIQLSSPCKMSKPFGRGFKMAQYSFKKLNSHSVKQRNSNLVQSSFNSNQEFSETRTTAL